MNRGCLLLVSSLFYSTGHIEGGRAQEPQIFWVSVALVVEFEGAEMMQCVMDPRLKSAESYYFQNDQISCISSPRLSFLSFSDVKTIRNWKLSCEKITSNISAKDQISAISRGQHQIIIRLCTHIKFWIHINVHLVPALCTFRF